MTPHGWYLSMRFRAATRIPDENPIGHHPEDAVGVAGQDSGTITVLAIDTDAGVLTRSDSSLTIPSPTHLLAEPSARTEPNQREEQL